MQHVPVMSVFFTLQKDRSLRSFNSQTMHVGKCVNTHGRVWMVTPDLQTFVPKPNQILNTALSQQIWGYHLHTTTDNVSLVTI